MSNVQKVRSVYAAFGRGDVDAILAVLANDVEWEYGVSDAGVPWLQPLRGRAEVPKFFQSLSGLEITRFEPKTLLESGNIVVALLDLTAVVKATGRTISEEDEVHIWHFGGDGLVTRFRHRADTHQHWAAVHGK